MQLWFVVNNEYMCPKRNRSNPLNISCIILLPFKTVTHHVSLNYALSSTCVEQYKLLGFCTYVHFDVHKNKQK